MTPIDLLNAKASPDYFIVEGDDGFGIYDSATGFPCLGWDHDLTAFEVLKWLGDEPREVRHVRVERPPVEPREVRHVRVERPPVEPREVRHVRVVNRGTYSTKRR